VLSYEALADGMTPDQIVQKVLARIPLPDKPLATAPANGAAHA